MMEGLMVVLATVVIVLAVCVYLLWQRVEVLRKSAEHDEVLLQDADLERRVSDAEELELGGGVMVDWAWPVHKEE